MGRMDSHMQKNEVGPLTPYLNINSKWNGNLCVNSKTTKLLEEKIRVNFNSLGLGNVFFTMTQKAQAEKQKVDK